MAKEAGFNVIFGDASQEVVLQAANASEAVLLVVTIPGIVVSQAIIHNTRLLNADIQVVARLADTDFKDIFAKLQVRDLVYPEFEAGLEMTRQALLHLGLPVQEVHQYTEPLRQEFLKQEDQDEQLLQQYKTLAQLRTAEQGFDLEWFSVQESSSLLGLSLAEAEIRTKTGASVVGVLRDGRMESNPGPDFRLQNKDMVAVIGSNQARASFNALLVEEASPETPEPVIA